ncbi:MAG: hypothetical protein SYC29_04595 [Planctomycetota bacterium]|nr:hypothetical protein [Planctomycetota bacterium]
MFRITILSTIVAAIILTLTLSPVGRSATEPEARLRVGVYDSRAIAVAYAASDFNPVDEKMKQYEAAMAAGDESKVEKLEQWGERSQRRLHRQGFGRVPVTDLLAHVQDRFPEIAEQTDVDVIAFECNYLARDVEEVDITMALVSLYDPSPKTLKTAREVMKHEPISLEEIERHHEH